VYRADEATLVPAAEPNATTLHYEVMVGTELAIVIRSDGSGIVGDHRLWSGMLEISWDDWPRGALSGRGYNPKFRTYDGSYLPAAGRAAVPQVRYREGPTGVGYSLGVSVYSVAGDWFILDYQAAQVGTCNVALYDIMNDVAGPIYTLSFTHVPARDFNGDGAVDGEDFAVLASQWGSATEPNSPGCACDLNADHRVDVSDLALFSEYWLERTSCRPAEADPNSPPPGLCPGAPVGYGRPPAIGSVSCGDRAGRQSRTSSRYTFPRPPASCAVSSPTPMAILVTCSRSTPVAVNSLRAISHRLQASLATASGSGWLTSLLC
jgi:hypothetical protein